jgi:hypothetical protein
MRCMLGTGQGLTRGVAAGASNQLTVSLGRAAAALDDFVVLFPQQGWTLAGGADRYDALDSIRNLKFQQLIYTVVIDAAVVTHRGYRSRVASFEHHITSCHLESLRMICEESRVECTRHRCEGRAPMI